MAAGLNSRRYGALASSALRELRHLARDRWDLAFLTLFPWSLLLLMAWLLSNSVMRDLPVVAVDQDATASSLQLLRMVDASPGVRIVAQAPSLMQAESLVRARRGYAVVLVPGDMTRLILRGEKATVFAYYNATYMTAGQSAARDIADAVSAFNARALVENVGKQAGPGRLRAAPLQVQSAVLYNPARSYELFLLPLIVPALLSLLSALAMAGAVGRELRDGTLQQWLGEAPLAAVAGKLAPYVLLFTGYGMAMLVYIAWGRGDGLAGSVGLLAIGQLLLHLAGAGMALMFVAVNRDMGSGLSMVGLVTGASLAFSAATFPMIDAPLFTRVWSEMLPLTAYIRLQMEQEYIGSPWQVSLIPLGTMALIALVTFVAGMAALRAVVRSGNARERHA